MSGTDSDSADPESEPDAGTSAEADGVYSSIVLGRLKLLAMPGMDKDGTNSVSESDAGTGADGVDSGIVRGRPSLLSEPGTDSDGA